MFGCMNNTDRETMNIYLKDYVIPQLRLLDFRGSFPHFRRITGAKVNLLTFQFDLHGGGFVIEIANCIVDKTTLMWEDRIPVKRLTAHDLYTRKRIQSNMKTNSSLTEDWFRYDKKHLLGFGNIYLKVCKDVLSKFDLMKEYWDNGYINEQHDYTK